MHETVTKNVLREVDGRTVRVPQEVERRAWDAEVLQEREGCCHVKFLWPERPGARRYSGETGRNFPCIESFEAMVA
ncbi:hypothetical protein, partial [Brucella pseudintermedia]|uniref:hypothetical protein n=1 Tax=Brucella pseudintermedia TaxID=370111 RepID=UPI00320BD5EA